MYAVYVNSVIDLYYNCRYANRNGSLILENMQAVSVLREGKLAETTRKPESVQFMGRLYNTGYCLLLILTYPKW